MHLHVVPGDVSLHTVFSFCCYLGSTYGNLWECKVDTWDPLWPSSWSSDNSTEMDVLQSQLQIVHVSPRSSRSRMFYKRLPGWSDTSSHCIVHRIADWQEAGKWEVRASSPFPWVTEKNWATGSLGVLSVMEISGRSLQILVCFIVAGEVDW